MELYTKQNNRYKPYQPSMTDTEVTEGQILTLVGALAVTVIMQYQSLVPEHKRNARKIKAVETAILDLLQGSGHPISPEMSDYAVECWNKAVMTISQGVK